MIFVVFSSWLSHSIGRTYVLFSGTVPIGSASKQITENFFFKVSGQLKFRLDVNFFFTPFSRSHLLGWMTSSQVLYYLCIVAFRYFPLFLLTFLFFLSAFYLLSMSTNYLFLPNSFFLLFFLFLRIPLWPRERVPAVVPKIKYSSALL